MISADNEEEQAKRELKAMSPEELLLVDFDLYKWYCSGKGCRRSTKIRDYGIAPDYYAPALRRIWFRSYARFYLCGKHSKIWKRLIKNYDPQKVADKILDFSNNRLERIEK